MFEGIIANLLNKYLGDFIDGIDASQLKISAFSGDVELFNLSVRKDI
jgi:vacuolar protein sorting-associated protein 13A/C